MKFLFVHIRNFYGRFERPISSISLIGGFVFDAIALKRVDLFWENFWVVVHLAVVAICIILINRQENHAGDERNPATAHFWYINVLQFFFGGLLSTFLVFYFRSSSLTTSWPFLLLLALAFVANERLKHHYARVAFQISLFYLSLFSFAIFIVPVLFHRIGRDIFIASGVISLVVLWVFLRSLRYFAEEKFRRSRIVLIISIFGIFLITNLLYFLNLIPPIPLSLKDGGIYHNISRDNAGDYTVFSENPGLLGYVTLWPKVHIVQGDSVYAYSAIFSPALFNTDIVHEWQKFDEDNLMWVTMNRTTLATHGGREDGYRTYSVNTNVTPGKWRVNVETTSGQVIGRLRFSVSYVTSEPELSMDTKQ